MSKGSSQPLAISKLDQQQCAEQIHALQMLAYRQEADLLQIRDFPPLHRTVADIRQQPTQYWGIWQHGQTPILIAAIGLETIVDAANAAESASRGERMLIASLVVASNYQRQGLAKRLLRYSINRLPKTAWQVSTASQNQAALQLYQSCGFVEERRFQRPIDGNQQLQLVQLHRPAG